MSKARTIAQQYAAIQRLVTYDKSGSYCYASCGADTRMEITLLIPRIAKACANDLLALHAEKLAIAAKRDGV